MTYAEDDLLPISALQHLAYCERQWGLIHLECVWEENRLTAEGSVLHDRVHEARSELRGDVLTVRGLRLRNLRLGLAGISDAVEFHACRDPAEPGVSLPGRAGQWRPFPVEYKRGKPKPDRCDDVQVCAQALCLEEMLGIGVPAGALYYGQTRRRVDLDFDESLRAETERLAARLHELSRAGATPRAEFGKKCRNCSLLDACMPEAVGPKRDIRRYLGRAFNIDPEDTK